jgi:2-oxoacid:acceptor oxidoreductase gamma subunit (pyruvate/2-ketoisovalerate family)
MIEIKFLGKGGQGVVVASEMLARACFEEGLYPQCYSLFGGERRGAPVAAFVRIDDKKIFLKCDIDRPNHFVLFDSSLFNDKEIVEVVQPGGSLLLNMERSLSSEALEALKKYKVGQINAFEISEKVGLRGLVNTAMLGAYVCLSQVVPLGRLLKVIGENVPAAIDQNIMAAKEAYESLCII